MSSRKIDFRQKLDFEMTARERSACDFLIVEPDPENRDRTRSVLIENGYTNMYHAADHMQALNVLMTRNFTHTLFSTTYTNMPVSEYVSRAIATTPNLIAIASSYEPNADDVFDLLRLGARGFAVKPYTLEGMESSILMATKGDRLSEAVLQARDRNEAFAALIAANLDKLADGTRHALRFQSAARDIERLQANFKGATDLARMFAKDGEEALRDRMVDFFIDLSTGPASRLGRLRHRLRKKRSTLDSDTEKSVTAPNLKKSVSQGS